MIDGRIEKVKLPIFMLIFFITLMFSRQKQNLNYLSAQEISKDIVGVGKVKSEKIVEERDKNGLYKNSEDFFVRTNPKGIGKIVYSKIDEKYVINN